MFPMYIIWPHCIKSCWATLCSKGCVILFFAGSMVGVMSQYFGEPIQCDFKVCLQLPNSWSNLQMVLQNCAIITSCFVLSKACSADIQLNRKRH